MIITFQLSEGMGIKEHTSFIDIEWGVPIPRIGETIEYKDQEYTVEVVLYKLESKKIFVMAKD